MAFQYRQFCQCGYKTPWESEEKDAMLCPKCKRRQMRRMRDYIEGSDDETPVEDSGDSIDLIILEKRVAALEESMEKIKDAMGAYLPVDRGEL